MPWPPLDKLGPSPRHSGILEHGGVSGSGRAGGADFSQREKCHQRAATAKVPSVRLRDILEREPVDLLKLDIEGAEFAVLRDCDGALGRVQNILIEVHRFRDGDGQLGELLAVLERNGFDYALGDLHAATWIESAARPPFSACASRHFIVTVFAWRAQGNDGTDQTHGTHGAHERGESHARQAVTPRPTADAVLREAVDHLNARRESDALRCFEQAAASGAAGPHLQYGCSIALARLGRHAEARQLLAEFQRQVPTHPRAAALVAELDALAATPTRTS